MTAKFTQEDIAEFVYARNLEATSLQDVIGKVIKDDRILRYVPEALCQIDPRDGDLVVYNSSRSHRTHMSAGAMPEPEDDSDRCPICKKQMTPIIDIADLSEGFTFINKNLYPIFHPLNRLIDEILEQPLPPDPLHHGRKSTGIHLLQWTSSLHDRDWHNMPQADCEIVMGRLAALESKLLHEAREFMPASQPPMGDKKTFGYVSIIKNYGHAAGASLTHGHQQIGFNNIMPSKFFNNLCFYNRNRRVFSQYMLDENPKDLLVKDFGKAVLIVPYFMRRAFDMLLILKDTTKQFIHELDEEELNQVTGGMRKAIGAILRLMHQQGKVPSYNMTVNNGPGAGLYFEFLAHTQELGGFEHLGLWVCQANQYEVAQQLRETIVL